MAWTSQRGGRWVGEWMEKNRVYRFFIVDARMMHEQIKEWFLNEYERQG